MYPDYSMLNFSSTEESPQGIKVIGFYLRLYCQDTVGDLNVLPNCKLLTTITFSMLYGHYKYLEHIFSRLLIRNSRSGQQ